MKIITIGGSGMIGSRFLELLSHKYQFDDLGRAIGVDITKSENLEIIKNNSEHAIVILFAAKADVDSCEKDKELGENGEAWKINVGGVKNVVDACLSSKKKLIYISTDFVFSGEEPPVGGYKESDIPDPLNWYGETKYMGELIVKSANLDSLILRIAYPYRKKFDKKKDFVRAIIERLQSGQKISAIVDHIFSPTYIDDIVHALDRLIEKEETGVFHVTGSDSLTPYDAAILIADKFKFNKNLISKTTRKDFFNGKALRPFDLTMNNDKIKKLGINMRAFKHGMEAIK